MIYIYFFFTVAELKQSRRNYASLYSLFSFAVVLIVYLLLLLTVIGFEHCGFSPFKIIMKVVISLWNLLNNFK